MGREPSVSGSNPSGSPRLTLTGTSLFETPSAPHLASPMEVESLYVCLLSTVHASTSGLATGWDARGQTGRTATTRGRAPVTFVALAALSGRAPTGRTRPAADDRGGTPRR
jgi:hypothetical protein